MTQATKDVFIDSFDSLVHEAYQGRKSLKLTVRNKTGVIGSTHKFPKAGRGVATQHNRGNDVVAMNAGRSRVTATLEDWNAFDYSDVMDLNKINFDDKKIIANNTIAAIERREDQLIIDAIYADYAGGNTKIGDGTAAFSVDYIRTAGYTFDENNIPMEGRCIAFTAKQKEQLLNETEATSSDYNSVKTLVMGEIDTFYGFKFITIGYREEGGLPSLGTNKELALAYHKDAVGLAIGKDMTTMVDWVAEKLSWQIGCVYSAGAVVIDNEGVVGIDTLATA